MINRYWKVIENDIPRFLSQLDCNPISSTYGSFDRSFWHLRRADFSSAALQQGVLTLALLYRGSYENNDLFKKSEVLDWIKAALNYTFKIQHKDGSMDEWYPQERGWAGPTGYVLYAVIRSLELTHEYLEAEQIEKARLFSERAIRHLLNFEEGDVLANHQAMALLAIETAQKYFKLPAASEKKEKLWNRFLNSFSTEGWSLEYDGCDPGYQTATLSFMSRLHRANPSEEIKKLCLQQIHFLEQFLFPDNSFAGAMGSRGTTNVFHFGFEYWAHESNLASKLSQATLSGVEKGSCLAPRDQEDHYLIYRLPEFLESADIYFSKNEVPWSQPLGQVYSEQSGLFKISTKKYYGLINLHKNASGKIYDLTNHQYVFQDSGYFFESSDGKKFCSSFIQSSRALSITEDKLTIDGFFNVYKRPVFSQQSFWLFRSALLVTRNSLLSHFLKIWIRSKIMTDFAIAPCLQIKREIVLGDKIHITDKIYSNGITLKSGFRSLNFPSRAVPQSLYHLKKYLSEKNIINLDAEINNLNKNKQIELVAL